MRLRLPALLLLTLHLGGCWKYTPIPTDPRAHVAAEPQLVRVISQDGERLGLAQPYIANDSILQAAPDCRFDRVLSRRVCRNVGMPLAEIAELESRSPNYAVMGPLYVLTLGGLVVGGIWMLGSGYQGLGPASN